jgi:hypothetical protein
MVGFLINKNVPALTAGDQAFRAYTLKPFDESRFNDFMNLHNLSSHSKSEK